MMLYYRRPVELNFSSLAETAYMKCQKLRQTLALVFFLSFSVSLRGGYQSTHFGPL